jgi:hypothetical protein
VRTRKHFVCRLGRAVDLSGTRGAISLSPDALPQRRVHA